MLFHFYLLDRIMLSWYHVFHANIKPSINLFFFATETCKQLVTNFRILFAHAFVCFDFWTNFLSLSKTIRHLPIYRHLRTDQPSPRQPTAQITTRNHVHIIPSPGSNCFDVPVSRNGALTQQSDEVVTTQFFVVFVDEADGDVAPFWERERERQWENDKYVRKYYANEILFMHTKTNLHCRPISATH